MKNIWKWLMVFLVVVAWAVAAIVYGLMPKLVVSHWGLMGEPNGYMGKLWGTITLPLLMTVMFVGLQFVPKFDPKKKEIEKFRSDYDRFGFFLQLFMLYIFGLVIAWNLGLIFEMGKMMAMGMAVLYWESGRLIGRANPNYTIGIRTSWTLASDEVWRKTHALGEKLFKVSAVLGLMGFVDERGAFGWVILPIVVSSVVMIGYSAVIYHRKK